MDQGIVVGCNQMLEWILPWWWEHYSTHNDYPIAFFDFGMSEKGKAWCAKRGQLKTLDSVNLHFYCEPEISLEKKIKWESQYGEGVWHVRAAWLKKPIAMAQSPFSTGLWLDLDCRVDGNLKPLFDLLQENHGFAISKYEIKDSNRYYFDSRSYNSGVIVFNQKTPILKLWVQSILESPNELPGDEDYLSQVIELHRPKIVLMPPIYNWSREKEKNPQALIVHFHGGEGKITLLKEIGPDRFPHLLD